MSDQQYASMIETGAMDERDIDHLEHLSIPEVTEEVAMEGILRAVGHDAATIYTDAYREMKGWFLGIESKRKYTVEICDDLIDWLKDKNLDHRDMDLDMGTFKTWMKTSETFYWRYYFILNEDTWRRMEKDLDKGNITELESLYDVSFKDRKIMTRYFDSITNIKDLIKEVETYKTRVNRFYDLVVKRKRRSKLSHFKSFCWALRTSVAPLRKL